MTTKKPFVDFYNRHRVLPVAQDLRDMNDFTYKRNFLYASLGVPLRSLAGRKIIEFGPGGGYNAVATMKYGPDLYVFVDASAASIDELNNKIRDKKFAANYLEVHDSDILEFRDLRKFDLVIIEGVIPGQSKPREMLRKVSEFVDNNGIIITSSCSSVSLLSEICRRLFYVRIKSEHLDFDSQVNEASRIFISHLNHLNTKTRSARDWVIDSIIQKWETRNYNFTVADTVDALNTDFDFYNSSPRFFVDDRFYKSVSRSKNNINEIVKYQYEKLSIGFIDYRVPLINASNFDLAQKEIV
jgi:2-polyprenyl-3-methyl-5-hydroxy-6-metoxy-1,4-benzoquinol methylase